MVRLILEQVDSESALINLYQFKAFDRVEHRFLGAVLESVGRSVGRLQGVLSILDQSLISVPGCGGGSERSKVKTFHAVQINSSMFPAFTNAVHFCVGTLPAQVNGESGPR